MHAVPTATACPFRNVLFGTSVPGCACRNWRGGARLCVRPVVSDPPPGLRYGLTRLPSRGGHHRTRRGASARRAVTMDDATETAGIDEATPVVFDLLRAGRRWSSRCPFDCVADHFNGSLRRPSCRGLAAVSHRHSFLPVSARNSGWRPADPVVVSQKPLKIRVIRSLC